MQSSRLGCAVAGSKRSKMCVPLVLDQCLPEFESISNRNVAIGIGIGLLCELIGPLGILWHGQVASYAHLLGTKFRPSAPRTRSIHSIVKTR